MKKSLLPLAAAFAVSSLLTACNNDPIAADSRADPTAAEVAAAPKVELPPAISASKVYRCKDSSLVYIDFFADNLGANFRTVRTEAPVRLTAPAAGEPFVAEGGYSLSGSGSSVKLARPGKPAQDCNS